MTDENTPRVDLHVHAFPDRMFEAVWRYFEERDWRVHRQQAAELERTLAAHGVERAVALSYPHRAGVAAPLNQFMETLGREHPLFLPFASVHVDDEDLRACVDRALASPHLYGFKFQPLVQRFDINHPRLDYLYEACLEADFPLLMHVGTAPVANPYVGHAHFWLGGRCLALGPLRVPLSVIITLAFALPEELAQGWSSIRAVEGLDMISDLTGALAFAWLASRLLARLRAAEELQTG